MTSNGKNFILNFMKNESIGSNAKGEHMDSKVIS
jgi:hypothetical protein